jgi:predicted transcriptional regulator
MGKRERNQLEAEILEILWAAKVESNQSLSSQQILDALLPNGSLALTTVLTVLSRLADKGLVVKSPGEGRSLLFGAAETKEEHSAKLMLQLLDATSNPSLAFSHFASSLSPEQVTLLKASLKQEL